MTAYYNEFDPYAAQWLRNLIAAGHIAPGDVDERSIVDVNADDLKGYTQCHFFAGIGGWSYAARLAGWHDSRELWTGSCPCQPFSSSGREKGFNDPRHLWPAFFRLIKCGEPSVVMGEQVAAAVGKDWLDRVYSDLEAVGYACRSAIVPACAVDAPHKRDRLWFVADADRKGRPQRNAGTVPSAAESHTRPPSFQRHGNSFGDPCPSGRWIRGADGKARRIEPGVRLLADGVPARVAKLRALGNAIVPQVAAQVIAAYMEVTA